MSQAASTITRIHLAMTAASSAQARPAGTGRCCRIQTQKAVTAMMSWIRFASASAYSGHHASRRHPRTRRGSPLGRGSPSRAGADRKARPSPTQEAMNTTSKPASTLSQIHRSLN